MKVSGRGRQSMSSKLERPMKLLDCVQIEYDEVRGRRSIFAIGVMEEIIAKLIEELPIDDGQVRDLGLAAKWIPTTIGCTSE